MEETDSATHGHQSQLKQRFDTNIQSLCDAHADSSVKFRHLVDDVAMVTSRCCQLEELAQEASTKRTFQDGLERRMRTLECQLAKMAPRTCGFGTESS